MAHPKAYDPQFGYKYQILLWDKNCREYDHLDYAKDKTELDYLLGEYRLLYKNEFNHKVILFPQKYWKEK